jgi:hypothetical protein
MEPKYLALTALVVITAVWLVSVVSSYLPRI